MAMRAAALWCPYPRWLISRILEFKPSSLLLLSPSSTAARIRSRLSRTVLDKVTKARDPAAAGAGQPPVQMHRGVGGVGEPVEVTQVLP